MSNSWRKYGGKGVLANETINVGTVVASQFLTRSTSATTNTFDNVNILGEAYIHYDATLFRDLYVKHNEYISNNLYLKNKLQFGIDISNSIAPYAFMAGNQYKIGVNTSTPSTLFHITGNNTNVLTVDTSSAIIRNIIGQNVNRKGIVVATEDRYSNFYFYNDDTTDVDNIPNAYLRYQKGGYLTLSTLTAIDLSAANITSHFGQAVTHYDDNNIIAQTPGNILYNSSNVFINATSNFLFSYTNTSTSNATPSSSVILNQNGVNINTANDFYMTSPGGFISSVYNNSQKSKKITLSTTMTEVSSNIVISTSGVYDPIYDETMTVYDSSNSIFLFNMYDNSSAYTGNAITMVSTDNSSNTQMRIVTPNNKGMTMIGGVYPNDTARSIGKLGLTDIFGNFIPSHMFVSGKDPAKYYSTLGINTYMPKTERYTMDINGPTRIGNGEINTTASPNFEIKFMKFSKIHPLSGIAVGTPTTVFDLNPELNSYNQYILYSKDGGISWNNSGVGIGTLSYNDNNTFTALYVYDQSFSIIGTTQSNLLYTNNGGKNWYTLLYDIKTTLSTGINTDIGNDQRTINSIIISRSAGAGGAAGQYDIILFVNYTNPYYSKYNRSFQQYYSKYTIAPDTVIRNGGTITMAIAGNEAGPISNSRINGDCGNLFAYFVGNGIFEIYISSANELAQTSNTGKFYNSIYAYDDNNVIAVGNNVITWTINGAKNNGTSIQNDWTTIRPSDIFGITMNLQSVYIYDLSNAVAVGDNGVFLYSTNWQGGPLFWKIVPLELLNTSGIGDRIYNTNLRSIYMYDINSFVIANANTNYNKNLNQNGQSQIMYCYFPNLFNRPNNNVFDVSGNMVISGDININDSGQIFSNNSTFNILLNKKVKQINIGNNAASTDINGNLYVGNDVSFNSRLFVYGDSSYNSNFGILGNITVFNSNSVFANNLNVNTINSTMPSIINIGNDASYINIGPNIKGGKNIAIGSDVTNYLTPAFEKNTIFIGRPSSRVVISGSAEIMNITNTQFMIPLLKLNGSQYGPISNTGTLSINQDYFQPGAGISIRDMDNPYAGYFLVSNDTYGYYFKAPGSNNTVNLNVNSLQLPINNLEQLNVSNNNIQNGIMVLTKDTDTVNRANYAITVKPLDVSNITLRDSYVSTNSYQQIFTNLGVSGDLTVLFRNRLFVYGDVSLNSRAFINSDVSINQRLFVSEDVSFNSNLYIAKSLCIDTSGYQSFYNLDVSGSNNFRGTTNPINLIDNSVLLTNTPALDFSFNFCNKWMIVPTSLSKKWNKIAMSSNGLYQTAVIDDIDDDYGIWLSNNYGITWFQNRNINKSNWNGIAMSSDGKTQVSISGIELYLSNDYGITWNNLDNLNNTSYKLYSVAISANGQFISTIGYFNSTTIVFSSTNYGNSFNSNILSNNSLNTYTYDLCSIVISATGQYQACCINSISNVVNNVFISNNYGLNWVKVNLEYNNYLNCISISSSGQYIAIGSYNTGSDYISNLFISSNYGTSFSLTFSSPLYSFNGISISANGQYIVAISGSTYKMIASTNYGNNWMTGDAPEIDWKCIAMSANGQYLNACINNGNIYYSITPYINMSISNNLIVYKDVSFNARLFISGPVIQF